MTNHRDLALAAMRGEAVDRVPFSARMDLWYSYHRNCGTLPAPYEHAELWDIQRDLDIGIFGFGAWDISFYKSQFADVEIDTSTKYGETVTYIVTPYGELSSVDVMSEEMMDAAGTAARTVFPFKSPADYDALEYLFDHTKITENYDVYGRFVESIGTDGIALPFSGHLPAHQLMIKYMGYEQFYYELYENEARVERLISAIQRQQSEILDLASRCPAQAIEIGANYDEEMTPPPVFERFFAPFYRDAREVLSKAGKILVVHGDGEMRVLLKLLMECGVQVVEALTPQPMTTIDLRQTRELWKDRVTMWGGLPSVIFTPVFSESEFESYLQSMTDALGPLDRFILGFGDNAPTDALFDRIRRVAEHSRSLTGGGAHTNVR